MERNWKLSNLEKLHSIQNMMEGYCEIENQKLPKSINIFFKDIEKDLEKLALYEELERRYNVDYWLLGINLSFVETIKKHINRFVKYEPKKLENDVSLERITAYYTEQADEEAIRVIIDWLKANIDKERLKEWLENDKV